MKKKSSTEESGKRWYNPNFFKTKFFFLCLGLCFIYLVVWLESKVPDLTALPGVWKSETGQIMAVSGKRSSVANLDYTLYDGNLVFDGQTFAKEETAVFTKLENGLLLVEFGDAWLIMLSDRELFYKGSTFHKDRFYFQNHYDFKEVVAPVGEPIHLGFIMDTMMRLIYSLIAVVAIYWLLQSMFPWFSVSILIPKGIRQKWDNWRKKKEERDKKKTPKPVASAFKGTVQPFLQTLYAIGAKIWWFVIGCFTVLVVIGGIYGVAGAFNPGLIVNSDDLPGLWKTKDGTVLAISTIHDDRGRGTTQYDWEIVRDGEMLLDWGDVYSDDSEEGYEAILRLSDGKTAEHVFYMKGADQMVFDGETYHKLETEEKSYDFGNMVARVGFDNQTAPQLSPWFFLMMVIIFIIWVVYESRKQTTAMKKANQKMLVKKGKRKKP